MFEEAAKRSELEMEQRRREENEKRKEEFEKRKEEQRKREEEKKEEEDIRKREEEVRKRLEAVRSRQEQAISNSKEPTCTIWVSSLQIHFLEIDFHFIFLLADDEKRGPVLKRLQGDVQGSPLKSSQSMNSIPGMEHLCDMTSFFLTAIVQ